MQSKAVTAPLPCDETLNFSAVLLAAAQDGASRKTERTRKRLLASVAAQLMSGVDRSDLKVATVTASAGLAHGTFYRYFADMRMATEALIESFSVFVSDKLAAARHGEAGSRERVRGTTLAYTRLFRENAALMRCLIGLGSEGSAFAKSYQALNRAWYSRMAAAIARRRSQLPGGQAMAPADLLPTAYALGGMIDEFLTQLYLRKDPALERLAADEEAVAELLTELWCLGAYGQLTEQRRG